MLLSQLKVGGTPRNKSVLKKSIILMTYIDMANGFLMKINIYGTVLYKTKFYQSDRTTSFAQISTIDFYISYYSSQRNHRSRQYERGSSAERRYKRSHRRSPTSKKRPNRHRHERPSSRSQRRHRRSHSEDQVSIGVKCARTPYMMRNGQQGLFSVIDACGKISAFRFKVS